MPKKNTVEKEASPVEPNTEPAAEQIKSDYGDIQVGDPQELRPKELPLVIKPAEGKEWANDAQAEYAKVLNAYAYKNPPKWVAKKDKLIKQLITLAENPELLATYQGNVEGSNNISYNNKLIG